MIVPDYARPAALMVPHGPSTVLSTLEATAIAAAKQVGVILLSTEPAFTRSFVDNQPEPERFSIVAGTPETVWLRDRSPVAVRTRSGFRWVVPSVRTKRPRDDGLFHRITTRPVDYAPIAFATGNVIAGPNGVTLSTSRLLKENGLGDVAELAPAASIMGISRWLVVPPFPGELSGHIDVCARFLGRRLLAVAWNDQLRDGQAMVESIEEQVRTAIPGMRILRLPLRRDGCE